jgi:hypothetical protein
MLSAAAEPASSTSQPTTNSTRTSAGRDIRTAVMAPSGARADPANLKRGANPTRGVKPGPAGLGDRRIELIEEYARHVGTPTSSGSRLAGSPWKIRPRSPRCPSARGGCWSTPLGGRVGRPRSCPDGRVPEPGGWNRIQLPMDDLASEVDRLRAAGVRSRNDVVAGRGGSQILLEDPAGNLVELFQPASR